MTFEEFITKKKIDLLQFKTADPGLFSEFQSHYTQMGPKSFDHSKKFLFNKLRRAYHLKEELKPASIKESIVVNKIALQAKPLLPPSIEATVYTPRLTENQGSSSKNQDSSEKPKPAYVPRFRMGGENEAESGKRKAESETQDHEEKPRPAYVPRFKAQPIKSAEVSPEEEAKDIPLEPSKPTFKPRFKPGLTNTPALKPVEEIEFEAPTDKPQPAYVPRFRTGGEKEAESGKLKTESETQDHVENPKPTYVPRFKPPQK